MRSKIRVLHAIGDLNRGGAETWMMHVLRSIDRERYQMDFLVRTSERSDYYDEVLGLGSRIHHCTGQRKPWQFAARFAEIIAANPAYDILHGHLVRYDGITMWLGVRNRIPLRVKHSHCDCGPAHATASVPWKCYHNIDRFLLRRYATAGLACGLQAARWSFGPEWNTDPRWRILPYGVDLSPFRKPRLRAMRLREQLGIPPLAIVIGHVGRYHEQKNHPYLLEIAQEVCQRDPNFYFVLVGDGDLKPRITAEIHARQLQGRVLELGSRGDVSELMMSLMDVFVLPSLFEGFPLVMIEAQAARLPCIVSSTISPETKLLPEPVTALAIDGPADVWAERILATGRAPANCHSGSARCPLDGTDYDIDSSVRRLDAFYQSLLTNAGRGGLSTR